MRVAKRRCDSRSTLYWDCQGQQSNEIAHKSATSLSSVDDEILSDFYLWLLVAVATVNYRQRLLHASLGTQVAARAAPILQARCTAWISQRVKMYR